VKRLELLYDDRLDGRIEASVYDNKAPEIRQQQDQLGRRMGEGQALELPPANQAVDLMALTSRAADTFLAQPGLEQQKLLRLVLHSASWKGGELRMSFREPFAELRLSNRATHTNDNPLPLMEVNSGIWR
jgi:hypothetical protein